MTKPVSPSPAALDDLLAQPHAAELLDALQGHDAQFQPYVRTLARDLALPVETVRRLLLRMGALGLATYGPVFDDDTGRPHGSAWWLTEQGKALRDRPRQARPQAGKDRT